MLKLSIVDDQAGQRSEVVLEGEVVSIGRDQGCTIRLPERNVSRQHARVVMAEGAVFVEDAGSRYGIRVNGDPVTERTRIVPGDRVQLADYVVELHQERPGRAAPERPTLSRSAAGDLSETRDISVRGGGAKRAEMVPRKLRGRLDRLQGPEVSFVLDRSPLRVGGGSEADIRLPAEEVGDAEVELTWDDDTFVARSVGADGTCEVNGGALSTARLSAGDELRVGQVLLRFGAADGPVASSATDPALGELDPAFDVLPPTSSRSGERAFLVVLVVIALGAAAAYLLYFSSNDAMNRRSPADAPGVSSGPTAPAAPSADPEAFEPSSGAARSEAASAGTGATLKPGGGAVGAQLADHLDAARVAVTVKDWERAVAAFDAALALDPDHAAARQGRADALAESGRKSRVDRLATLIEEDPEEASAELERIREAFPVGSTYRPALEELASRLKRNLAERRIADGHRALEAGDAQRAIVLAAQARAVGGDAIVDAAAALEAAAAPTKGADTKGSGGSKPAAGAKPAGATSAAALYAQGREAEKNKDADAAIELYTKAILKDPRYAPAHRKLGDLYYKRNDKPKTRHHLTRYLELKPDAGDAAVVRGVLNQL